MNSKCKKILKIILIILSVILILNLSGKLFLRLAGSPDNGRNYTVTFWELPTIQEDPPAGKLIRYMNDKYGIKFRRYMGEEYLLNGYETDHTDSEGFAKYFNGILVETDEYPGHYFYVCDYYGTYLDDYYFHIHQYEAEQYFYKKLQSIIDSEFKVVCHPKYKQRYAVDSDLWSSEYINHCNYDFRIYISGDGKNADEELEAILSVIRPYLNAKDKWLRIYYVDSEQFNSVDSSDYLSYASDDFSYIKYGCGRVLFYEETQWEWEWIK
ncbi:MAG: hypothetical protein NC120_13435 [Ruminococcus sp.]|nr:hypothetical protein [Ruminococcus sp.]